MRVKRVQLCLRGGAKVLLWNDLRCAPWREYKFSGKGARARARELAAKICKQYGIDGFEEYE